MGVYVEQKSVLKTLDETIKEWDKNCGISRMEYLRIRFRNLPAADVAPVVHGRLIKPNPFGDCSVCGFLIDIRDCFNYFPNCGAKMDL